MCTRVCVRTVVDDRRDEGQHEAAAAPHFRMASAVLRVLPQDARILLVQANRLLHSPGLPWMAQANPLGLEGT